MMTAHHIKTRHGGHVALSADDSRVKSVQVIGKSSTEVHSSTNCSVVSGQDRTSYQAEKGCGSTFPSKVTGTSAIGSTCGYITPAGRNGYDKRIERVFDVCNACRDNRGESSIIFFEKLDVPLVFEAYMDNNCYDSGMDFFDVKERRKSSSDSEYSDEGIHIMTPVESVESNSDSENYHPTSPRAFIFPSSIQSQDNKCIYKCSCKNMDSNHNEKEIIKEYAFPVTGTNNEPIIMEAQTLRASPSPPSLLPMPRLTPVRESVSEMEDLVDCPDSSAVSDDPFLRRSGSVVANSSMDHSSWMAPPTISLNVPSPSTSDDVSPSASPVLSRRSRRSGVSSESEPTGRSPTLQRRRRVGTCLDIEEVKQLTSRLNLQTRRPSVHAWKQKYLSGDHTKSKTPPEDSKRTDQEYADSDVSWSRDFRDRISSSLEWVRKELESMREEDAILARRLLNIRKDMHKLKLQKSTFRHQLILEDAIEREEERDELQQIRDCDLTPDLFSPTLKQYGVTRMNLNSRRFSVF